MFEEIEVEGVLCKEVMRLIIGSKEETFTVFSSVGLSTGVDTVDTVEVTVVAVVRHTVGGESIVSRSSSLSERRGDCNEQSASLLTSFVKSTGTSDLSTWLRV